MDEPYDRKKPLPEKLREWADPRDASPGLLREQASGAGVAVSSVALNRFKDSGLTEASLRGADFVGFDHEAAEDVPVLIKTVVDAAGNVGAAICIAEATSLPPK